jgi:hypothetical protein
MRAREEDDAAETDDDPFSFMKEKSQSTVKSSALGVLFILLGAGMLIWAHSRGWMPRKVFFALVAMGPAVLWMGIGLIIFPLRGEQFDAFYERDQNIGKWFGALPGIWKIWAALAFVAMAAGFVYAIKVVG